MSKKKLDKSNLVNIEQHSRGNHHIDVTTRIDKFKQIYYVVHIGIKNSKGIWKNQYLLISNKDIYILNSLLQKSTLIAASVPKSGFVSSKDLIDRVNAKKYGVSYP